MEYFDDSLFVINDKNYKCVINFVWFNIRVQYIYIYKYNYNKIKTNHFMNIQVYILNMLQFTKDVDY